jgi:hypothetical protein
MKFRVKIERVMSEYKIVEMEADSLQYLQRLLCDDDCPGIPLNHEGWTIDKVSGYHTILCSVERNEVSQ